MGSSPESGRESSYVKVYETRKPFPNPGVSDIVLAVIILPYPVRGPAPQKPDYLKEQYESWDVGAEYWGAQKRFF